MNTKKSKMILLYIIVFDFSFNVVLQFDEGIEYSLLALEGGDDNPLASRAHVALGIGYSLKAMDVRLKDERQQLHNKALKAFQK